MTATSPFRITDFNVTVELKSRQLAELKKRGVKNVEATIASAGVERAEEKVLDFFKNRTLVPVTEVKGTFVEQVGDRFIYLVNVIK